MKRGRVWPVVALILLLGGLISGSTTLAQRAFFFRGWEDATNPDTLLPFRVPRPGVNAELSQYDEDELAVQLGDMAALGVVWVRQIFPWADIEPEPGVYRWERWDTIVQAVAEQDSLQLVAVLNFAPPWARHPLASNHPTAPPASNADFARFARLFAQRYGERLDYYQIWDEPNLSEAWGGLEPKAADYVALLQAAYTAIHAVDDSATVIAAGLAPTTETGPRNYNDVLFLRAMYENGGAGAFDAVAGKPYGFNSSPGDRRVDENLLNFSRLILLREEMVRQGDAQKLLWATQFGWNALPSGWRGPPSIWGEVSRDVQLVYVQEAYARAEREWPWLGGLILRHWQPDAPPDDPQWGFSLIPLGEERINIPALFGLDEAAGPGRHHPVSPFVTYSGEWEFGDLGADFGQSGNSEVEFAFEGTALALELRRDDYRAYLYVTVDSQPANTLPHDNEGQSYVILTSDDLEPHMDIVPVALRLNPGTHTAHLRAERGWDQWTLAAFRVGESPDTSGYDFALGVALVALLSGTGLFVATGRQLAALPGSWWKPMQRRLGETWHAALSVAASLLLMLGMLLTWQEAIPAILRRDPPGLLLGILTAGLLYFSDSMLLTGIAALLLFILIYNRLEIGPVLTLLWSPFFLFPLALYQFAFPMAEVCLLLTTAAWILRRLTVWAQTYKESPRRAVASGVAIRSLLRRFNALDWGVLLLVALALLSISWASHQAEAWREWRTLILEPALFYLVIRTSLRTSGHINHLADALLMAATAAALISIGLYLSGQGIITAEAGAPRMAGVYGSPNNVGLFMGRALPFALAYLLLPTGRMRRWLAGLAGIVMLAAALLSQSVGAILLGLPAGVVLTLWLWNARKAAVATVAIAVAGALAAIPLSQNPRFARLFDFSGGTSFFRVRLWQSAVQMVLDHPLRGVGLDQFLYQYRGRYILPEAWQEPNLSHPHNILLDFWTRLGLGGVLLLVWFQVNFWRAAWRIYREGSAHSPLLRAIILGAMGSMADLLAHGLIDNSIFVPDLSYVFVLLIALPTLIGSLRVDAKNEKWCNGGSSGPLG